MNDLQHPAKGISEQVLADSINFIAEHFNANPDLDFPNLNQTVRFFIYQDSRGNRYIGANFYPPDRWVVRAPEFRIGKDDPVKWAAKTWRKFKKESEHFNKNS